MEEEKFVGQNQDLVSKLIGCFWIENLTVEKEKKMKELKKFNGLEAFGHIIFFLPNSLSKHSLSYRWLV